MQVITLILDQKNYIYMQLGRLLRAEFQSPAVTLEPGQALVFLAVAAW